MRRVITAGAVAMATTFGTAPVIRRALVRWGSFDLPNHRSSHSIPVPRGGGLACAAGAALGLASLEGSPGVPRSVAVGLTALALTGLADDQLGNVPVPVRLGVQAASGCLFSGVHVTLPAASLVTAGVVNVVNFMDGINGISGGTAAVWGVSTLVVGRSEHDPVLAALGSVTAGVGLGFLPWNVPIAKLFLGDVGSYLIGGLMAAALAGRLSQPAIAWRTAAPLLLYGVDAAQAIMRRHHAGQHVTEAHREHIYQHLVDDAHLSHTHVATIHATAAVGIALATHFMSARIGAPVIALIASGYLASPMLARRWQRRFDGPASLDLPHNTTTS